MNWTVIVNKKMTKVVTPQDFVKAIQTGKAVAVNNPEYQGYSMDGEPFKFHTDEFVDKIEATQEPVNTTIED